jgi:hypothetical protein
MTKGFLSYAKVEVNIAVLERCSMYTTANIRGGGVVETSRLDAIVRGVDVDSMMCSSAG